jgi:hypothetical protein
MANPFVAALLNIKHALGASVSLDRGRGGGGMDNNRLSKICRTSLRMSPLAK